MTNKEKAFASYGEARRITQHICAQYPEMDFDEVFNRIKDMSTKDLMNFTVNLRSGRIMDDGVVHDEKDNG